MPTSVGSSLIGLALVCAILGIAPAALLVGVGAVIWESVLFYMAGRVT